jgi:hypothetical protein
VLLLAGEGSDLEDEFTTMCARIGYVATLSDLVKHSLIKAKIIVALDARLKGGDQSVLPGAWARVGADGVNCLTLVEVRAMAQGCSAAASKSSLIRCQFFL